MAGNIIQSATFRAALDPGGYESGGDRMIRKSAEITNAVDRVSESTTKASRSAALSAQGFDRLLASLDPNIQRAQNYSRELEKLNRYHEAGIASANQYSTALQLLRDKYSDLTSITRDNAAAAETNAGRIRGLSDGLSVWALRAAGAYSVAGLFHTALRAINETAALTPERLEQLGLSIDRNIIDRAKQATHWLEQMRTSMLAAISDTATGNIFPNPFADLSHGYDVLSGRSTLNRLGGPFAAPTNRGSVVGFSNSDLMAYYQANGASFKEWQASLEKQREDRQKALDEAAQKAKDDADRFEREMREQMDRIRNSFKIDKIPLLNAYDAFNPANPNPGFGQSNRILENAKAEQEARQSAERQAAAARDAMEREQERAARESERFWDRMFDNVFTSGHADFSKFLEDLAIEAYARPIIVPVLQQLGSALGIGGAGIGGGAGALSGLGGGGLAGALGSISGLGGGLLGPGGAISLGNTGHGFDTFGTSAAGVPGVGSLSGVLGSGLTGLGIGSMNLFGGNSTGSTIGGTVGGIAGSFLGPLGSIAGSFVGSAIGGMFGNKKPSNYTAYANFGSDYSLLGGVAGDKPNQNTTGLAQSAGQQIAAAAAQLQAAGVTLATGVQRLEIGQRDQSRLYLTSGKRIDIGAAGDANAAVQGTLGYLLNGATASDSALQAVLNATKGQGADSILAALTSVKGLNADTDHAIAQFTNPVLAQWNDLLKVEQDRIDLAKKYNVDTTLLDRRSFLEREAFLKQLTDDQRRSLGAMVDLSGSLAAKLADAQSAAQSAVTGQLGALRGTSGTQRGLASSYLSASTSLTSSLNALSVSDLSSGGPIDRYNAARSQLVAARGSALSGNVDALQSLSGLASTFLSESRNVNASTSAYGADFDFAKSVLGGAASAASGLGSSAAHAADVADAQLNVLQSIDTALRSPSLDTGFLQKQTDLLQALKDGTADAKDVQQATADAVADLSAAIDQLRRLLTVNTQQAA